MQVDMHYYGTFAMAKAAGLKDHICKIIATAAEFVDDNAGHRNLNAKDRGHLHVTATAHHSIDGDNLNNDDQREVWVPFHFLPGAEGDTHEEKLRCVKDSPIARTMLAHHLSMSGKSFGPHLVGIAAHVYCDTFAHYGFSGVSSSVNRVDEKSFEFDSDLPSASKGYILDKFNKFKLRFASTAAEELSKGLGHGAVHTFPDRPYLRWRFKYEDGTDSGLRSNPDTFFEACRKLHKFFIDYAEANPDSRQGEPTQFDDMAEAIANILAKSCKVDERVNLWKGAAAAGLLYKNGSEIPDYSVDEWMGQLESIERMEDSEAALSLDAFRFLQAAAHHRTYVLRDLLPEHGILVR